MDGDGRPKPLFYAIRQAYADRLLTVQPRDGHLAVVAVNDSDDAWCGSLSMARSSFDGRVAVATDMQLSVVARDSATIALPADVATREDESSELIVVHVGSARALWFFREDRDQALPAPAFDVSCKAVTGGYQVRVTARSLLRDLTILADRVAADARVDEMLVTLLPGESAVFHIETVAQVDPGSSPIPRSCAPPTSSSRASCADRRRRSHR